jgi:hypothetical protein
MNFDLAKQLKDAGFVQPMNLEDTLPIGGVYTQMGSEGEPVYTPTLSELIEKCGSQFHSLEKDGGKFAAFCKGDVAERKTGSGDSPEEAVARLWLALQRK